MHSDLPSVPTERLAEIAKYHVSYRDPAYRMGPERKAALQYWLTEHTPTHESYLDVGCGRGESLGIARKAGFSNACGLEVLAELCGPDISLMPGVHAIALQDRSFDLVTCLDVLEHITEADVPAGLRELVRITNRRLLISVAWWSTMHRGVELHVTRHPEPWWLMQAEAAAAEFGAHVRAWGPPRHCQRREACWLEVVR